jgi:hypothetical protein
VGTTVAGPEKETFRKDRAMTQARTPQHEQQRAEGQASHPEDKLPTYQELLDHAVEDTFPASDPIAPNAARNTSRPVETAVDDRDWKLSPTDPQPKRPKEVVAEFDDEEAARRARDEALAAELPTARLDVPSADRGDRPGATVTVVACDESQRRKAEKIARASGAAKVEARRAEKPEG